MLAITLRSHFHDQYYLPTPTAQYGNVENQVGDRKLPANVVLLDLVPHCCVDGQRNKYADHQSANWRHKQCLALGVSAVDTQSIVQTIYEH